MSVFNTALHEDYSILFSLTQATESLNALMKLCIVDDEMPNSLKFYFEKHSS